MKIFFNEYGELRLVWMIIIFVICALLFASLAIFLFYYVYNASVTGRYTYKDYNGQVGYAKQCYETRGQLLCIEDNGTKKAVVEYERND